MGGQQATRQSRKTLPFPSQQAPLSLALHFSKAEFDALSRGLVPTIMEDKWFVFYEAPWLHFHRSWTGSGIFRIRLSESSDGWRVAEAYVSRDSSQYVSTDDEYDIQLLRYLIERLLLSREVAFPVAPDLQGKLDPAVIKMNVVGYARSRDEIEKGP